VVRVAQGEDPAAVAERLGDHIGAEPVKRRWLAQVLQIGARRDSEVVGSHGFTLPDGREATVEVRAGDDLQSLATFRGLQLGLEDAGINMVAQHLRERTPQHDSPAGGGVEIVLCPDARRGNRFLLVPF